MTVKFFAFVGTAAFVKVKPLIVQWKIVNSLFTETKVWSPYNPNCGIEVFFRGDESLQDSVIHFFPMKQEILYGFG